MRALPAPLAPSTAMRLLSATRTFTSDSCCLDAPGYVKPTCQRHGALSELWWAYTGAVRIADSMM